MVGRLASSVPVARAKTSRTAHPPHSFLTALNDAAAVASRTRRALGVFIVDLCLLYERQHLRNQSNSSLDGAPPLQERSSCQNSKSNTPTPEAMAPITPAMALAMSSWAPGAWSMLSRPPRAVRRSRDVSWLVSFGWSTKSTSFEFTKGSSSRYRSLFGFGAAS